MESMEIKGRNILVTGGAGFIGAHLVQKLIGLQAKVYVIDIENDSKSYFAQNKLEKKCKFDIVDIRDQKEVKEYFSKNKIDYIFHLAAEPIVEKAFENPYSTFETNIMGTVNILERVRLNKKIKGLIVASSDKAYGKTEKTYAEESPLKGDHPYDVSKSAADLICQTYYKTYGCPVVVTRFGNVYGEGDLHLNRIVPGICEAVIKNKTLMVRSDGTYIRDYLYVKDVADGYLFLLKNFEKVKGQAFNFSSDDTLSVLDLIKKAEKILKTKINYKILNIAKNEIPYQHLNDEKVRKLGWSCAYNFSNSLPLALKWYNSWL
jgi:CDP-glucose 4,6-dehydratase